MEKIENVWGFVEAYYPNYFKCNDIAENEDLNKIVIGELYGNAASIYTQIETELYGLNGVLPEEFQIIEVVEARLNESYAKIYTKAIEGYLEMLKY